MRQSKNLQCRVVIVRQGHRFGDMWQNPCRTLYFAELIPRQSYEPGRTGCRRQVQSAHERAQRHVHTACGSLKPGVDRFPVNGFNTDRQQGLSGYA